MKVKRETLLNALVMVSPGLSARDVIEQSNSYCFEKNRVFTYDDETACIMPSPVDITGAVPAEPLRGMLEKMKEEFIEVTQTKSELQIKGKGQRFGIRMESKIELPIDNLEIPKKWKKLPDRFSEALKLVAPCAGKDESSFEMTCIHLTKEFVEASDSFQYARFMIDIPLKESTLVRQVSLKNIIDLDMKEISETDQWVHFQNSSGLTLSCRRFADKYPDMTRLATVSGDKIQLPKSLSDNAQRAEEMSKHDPKENHIRVDIVPGWVRVKGEGQYGWYRGRRKLKYTGESMSFMVHPQMLAQIVKQHSDCEICNGTLKALKAEIGDFVFSTCLSEPPKESNGFVKPNESMKKKSKKSRTMVKPKA